MRWGADMRVNATIITAEGHRVSLTGRCDRKTMEQIIDGAYPGARRVSLIVVREQTPCAS